MTPSNYETRLESRMAAWDADIRARRRNWYRLLVMAAAVGAIAGLASWI